MRFNASVRSRNALAQEKRRASLHFSEPTDILRVVASAGHRLVVRDLSHLQGTSLERSRRTSHRNRQLPMCIERPKAMSTCELLSSDTQTVANELMLNDGRGLNG